LSDTGDLFRFDDTNDKATQTADVFRAVSGTNAASIFIEVPIQDVMRGIGLLGQRTELYKWEDALGYGSCRSLPLCY